MRFLYFILVFILFSCSEEPEVEKEIKWSKEQSTGFNKSLAIDEQINIKLFLEMHKSYEMTKTGSGLQYYIYENGKVDTMYTPRVGDIAEIEYTVTMLDGTVCSKTEEGEFEQFMVDNSEIETGIQEGIKKLTIGDRAKLIIPSHLGHGLLGDQDKIPPLTTLVIDLHLIGIMI